MSSNTADLMDDYGDSAWSCDTQFTQFGGRRWFEGPVRTISCAGDNGLVKQLLAQEGKGQVLVIDGGGSLHTALMGDVIATSAVALGWAGVVIHGAVRDSVILATLDLGVKALGANPRKSSKMGEGTVDCSVVFGGATFRPGAYLWSDDDGIVVRN